MGYEREWKKWHVAHLDWRWSRPLDIMEILTRDKEVRIERNLEREMFQNH